MKISLAEWKTIENALRDLHRAAEVADSRIADIMLDHARAGNNTEKKLLTSISDKVHELRMKSFFNDVHPQSEWTGGDSDLASNHKLREPNICPLPRRHFTVKEMAEVGAENHGACSWTFDPAEKESP